MYGEGISYEGELVELGSSGEFGDIVEKSGSWFSYNGEKLGQGKENAKRFLKENPAIAKEIEDKIRNAHAAKVGLNLGASISEDEDEE